MSVFTIVALNPSFAVISNADAQAPGRNDGTTWQAHWIAFPSQSQSDKGLAKDNREQTQRMPLFRDEFMVRKAIAKASLRISGLGQYEAHINAHNVTDAVLTPGWTDYRKRVFYNTYDVSDRLVRGKNTIGVMLGRGMYDVPETKGRYTKFSGSFGTPKLIAQLDIRYVDGTTETISTDAGWRTAPGPITFSSVYGGEDFDARLEPSGWDGPAFDAPAWSHAEVVEGPGGILEPETIPPIKPFERFDPVSVTHPAPDVTVYDLGQNFSGWPEIQVSGERGTEIRMIAGELLDEHGFVTQHSANASPGDENSFSYTLKGQGLERWHPRFSYWGFRYVQVDGPESVIHHLDGRFLHDAVDVTGSFTSSDELFNRIHKLINMAMLSNMVSVLTDCPHREKLGWLEQTHLAAASLMYNYDLSTLYTKIADDMQDAQLANGLVPSIAPEFPVFEGAFRDSPEWGIADILSTWSAYEFYGDRNTLKNHYGSMVRYLDYLQGQTQNHLLTYGLGDWYDIGPGEPGPSKLTSKGVTATSVYYQALTRMERIAVLTGHANDVSRYKQEAARVKAAFNAEYFHPDTNQYDKGSQTADAMPLVVGLVPEDRRAAVLVNLIGDIRKHSDHVTAGDVGYHYVVRALTDGDRSDVLYDMLSRTDKPSYGDQLAHGATTLTEAWDADPNSSQNHFMLGHAEEWFYRGLAGIQFNLDRDRDERIIIHPAIVGNIHSARATFRSSRGDIESGWSINEDTLRMNVVIPRGSTATITLPSGFARGVRINGSPLRTGGAILKVEASSGSVRCVVSSGIFTIEASKL
ncbi:glycoside hydrolase family 78 protein [Granulicella aggregans]|uniref:glycoside hydrolase family 78 protein n=1 Tax=Granulicella aggregans TaxID=474949 RepID=UPI0021E0ACBB|nr:glycoside hydrolase family 78 protein [Granulicella aggregans]